MNSERTSPFVDRNDLIERVCGHAEAIGLAAAEWLAYHYDEDGYPDEDASAWHRKAQSRLCATCKKEQVKS